MSFEGFPEEALEFYEGLEADNSKAYWTDHKAIYDRAVAAPLAALLSELSSYGEAKVFRPYRDVRFSKDKTPYKTRQYAVVEGRLYVGIDAHGLHFGGGRFHLDAAQIARFRAAVDDARTGEQLVAILQGLRKKGFDVGGEQLKRVPKPWDAEHARADLLRHKALISWVDHEPSEWLHTARAKTEVAKAWKTLGPLNAWLTEHC